MTRGRMEIEGELVAWLIEHVQTAIYSSQPLSHEDLNPFKEPPPMSEALQAYYQSRAEARRRNIARKFEE